MLLLNTITVPGKISPFTPDFNLKGHWAGIMVTVSGKKISKAQLPAVACFSNSIDHISVGLGWRGDLHMRMSLDFVGPGTGLSLSFQRMDD